MLKKLPLCTVCTRALDITYGPLVTATMMVFASPSLMKASPPLLKAPPSIRVNAGSILRCGLTREDV